MLQEMINKAVQLEKEGFIDASLDIIYDSLDDLILAGEYQKVDSFLYNLVPDEYSTTIIIGILTLTYYASENLPSIGKFIVKVEKVFNKREIDFKIWE